MVFLSRHLTENCCFREGGWLFIPASFEVWLSTVLSVKLVECNSMHSGETYSKQEPDTTCN